MKALVIAFVTLTLAAGEDAPTTMTKLSVRLESTDVPEGSFATKPKTIYRAGSRYCRTEELPDPDQGIHGLLIVNEPDVWMVNLATKTAKHIVDPGPTFNCRMPIFVGEQAKPDPNVKSPLLELEFGREMEYFKGRSAIPQKGPVLQGKPTIAYVLDVGDTRLFLLTTGTPEQPLAVARQHSSVKEMMWYEGYAQLPFDVKLFAKPVGVTIEEIR